MVYRTGGLRDPRCPRCQLLLAELALDGGTALGCSGCGGVLLDDAGFAAVRERLYASILREAGAPPSLPESDMTPSLGCPSCGETMQRTHLASVPVDMCAE